MGTLAAGGPEPSNTIRSMAHMKAARVFPEPVGAQMRVDSPAMMCGQAAFCEGEGVSNRPVNQSRVAP